jgi:hypothetical protein
MINNTKLLSQNDNVSSDRGAVTDYTITWAIQLYRSRSQLEWCLPILRRHYPQSRVTLINDGDGTSYADIADQYACRYIHGEHLMTLSNCHRYVKRLLEVIVDGPEEYGFRIDPDTKIWRRFTHLPIVSAIFGTLETHSEATRDIIGPPANIQGGCIGMTLDVAHRILESNIVNYRSCVVEPYHTWARCSELRLAVRHQLFSDDFIISWAASVLKIPLLTSPEICSRWRRAATNEDLRYAITHPHKVGIDK